MKKGATKVAAERRAAHGPVLEVLCRVFDDGADAGIEEWREWYDPNDWFHWSRGLGAFIRLRMDRLQQVDTLGMMQAAAMCQRKAVKLRQAKHDFRMFVDGAELAASTLLTVADCLRDEARANGIETPLAAPIGENQ